LTFLLTKGSLCIGGLAGYSHDLAVVYLNSVAKQAQDCSLIAELWAGRQRSLLDRYLAFCKRENDAILAGELPRQQTLFQPAVAKQPKALIWPAWYAQC